MRSPHAAPCPRPLVWLATTLTVLATVTLVPVGIFWLAAPVPRPMAPKVVEAVTPEPVEDLMPDALWSPERAEAIFVRRWTR
jgi:hypothetical protein